MLKRAPFTSPGTQAEPSSLEWPDPAPRARTNEAPEARSFANRDLWLVPIAVFLLSRLFLEAMAVVAPHVLGALHNKNLPVLPRTDPLAGIWQWASPWFRFDASWYVGIAQHGYHWGSLGHANTNFMPLYPALIRLVQPLTLNSPWISAWLVANLAFLGALLLIWRWALLRWDRETALRVLLITTVFPFAFFYATPYAEPLFLALAVATFLFAEQDRWVLATCAAGLSSITRPVGLAVVVGLIVFALSRRQPRQALLASASILPLLGFMLYLTIAFGHPFAFLTYHSQAWVPPHAGLISTLTSQFHTKLSPFDRIDACLALLFLVSAVVAWRRLGAAYGVFVGLGVLLPLAHGLVSMERYVIVLFPAMAVWSTGKKKLGQTAVFSVSLFLLAMATMMMAANFELF